MTKDELIGCISKETGQNTEEIRTTVESLMNQIKDSLKNGKTIYLRGFGTFSPKQRNRTTGRDINKNIMIEIPPRKVPHFKPSKQFTNLLK